MASLYSHSSIAITFLCFLLFIALPSKSFSQDPLLADCTPQLLLPLAPCAPFVQGQATSQSPPPACCENLNDLYLQQPVCLCLLLNDTSFTTFPINRTLALRLPARCHLHVNIPACSGLPQVPTGSPTSQVSPGRQTNSSSGRHINSSVAASPVFQFAPRPVIMGIGLGRSAAGIKLKAEGIFVLLLTSAATILTNAVHPI